MTREQVKELFPDATEEQIKGLLNINGADIEGAKKNNVAPEELKRLQGIETEYNKLKDADLTDAEKIQKALDDAAAAEKDFTRKSNKLDVEKILVAAGLSEDDYKDLIDTLVSDDAERSKAAATAFASLVSKQKEAAVQKTKEEMMDGTQTPGGDGGSKEDEKTEDVKNIENLSFGGVDKNAQTTRNYYA